MQAENSLDSRMLKKAAFLPPQPRRSFHPPTLSLPRQPLHPGTSRSVAQGRTEGWLGRFFIARALLTCPHAGTPGHAISLGEGLPILRFPQKELADCSSLRASCDHRFIVGALRARRMAWLLLRIILKPRVAQAQGAYRAITPLAGGLFSILLM